MDDAYILGEDGGTIMVHLNQSNVKIVPMLQPPTDPEYRNETAQEGNGASTILAAVLDYEIITMASIIVSDQVVVAPVRNTLAVAPFPL